MLGVDKQAWCCNVMLRFEHLYPDFDAVGGTSCIFLLR
jgi:hypothetical protein